MNDPNSLIHVYAILPVFLFSVATIMFMVAWRQGKILLIKRLVDEVNRLAGEKHQEIEFVEESGSK